MRPNLVDACPLLRKSPADGQTPSSYLTFLSSCAGVLAERASSGEADAYAPCRTAGDLPASLRFAVYGLAGVLAGSPETSDADAARLVAAVWEGTWDAAARDSSRSADAKAAPAPAEEAPSGKKGLLGWIFNQ